MINRNPCVEAFNANHRDCLICDGHALVRKGERMMLEGLKEKDPNKWTRVRRVGRLFT